MSNRWLNDKIICQKDCKQFLRVIFKKDQYGIRNTPSPTPSLPPYIYYKYKLFFNLFIQVLAFHQNSKCQCLLYFCI